MTESRKNVCWWHMVLLAGTIFAAVTKIFIGIDQDEAYIVTMGVRLLNGDRLFDTMWELHMTSAWPAFLGLAAYKLVMGTLDGAVIFLRLLSTLLQFGTAWLAYRILKKYKSRNVAVLTGFAVANFLPRATQNLEYGLLEMIFVLLAVLLLYEELMRREDGEKAGCTRVICAGVLYALGVLAYPTIVLSFPVLLAALFFLQKQKNEDSKPQGGSRELSGGNMEMSHESGKLPCENRKLSGGRWKLPLAFAAVCGACAVIFMGYVLSYLPPGDFLSNLQGILTDGMHSDTVKTQTYFTQLAELLRRTGMIVLTAVFCWLCAYKWEKDKKLLWHDILLAGALIFIGFNVTGLRPSGPIGLQIRYILAAAAAIFFAVKKKDEKIAGLFLLPGIAIYAGAMAGSNMGFEENASFLYLAVFAAVALMTSYAEERGGYFCGVGLFCVGCSVAAIIFGKGALVRVTGTGAANIAEERVRIEEGILRGIYVYPEYAAKYALKAQEIAEYTTGDDVMLYLGDDALCSTFTEGSFTSATCISTPVYNEEWVLYYENGDHPQPTIIFLDKDAVETWEEFENTEFGAYIIEKYEVQETDVVEAEAFYILRLSREALQ